MGSYSPVPYWARCPKCQDFFSWVWDPAKGEWKVPEHAWDPKEKEWKVLAGAPPNLKNGFERCEGGGKSVKPTLKGVKA